jgi:flavin reductase (DIM6/NTAB) family NADH-FMN oxidoreductase RutF
MSNFIEIKPEQFEYSPFKLIGEDWMLITAEKEGKLNSMTASWGGLGVMWNKNVAYIAIRPQRYTKEFVDASDTFSLTFFDPSFKKDMAYIGSTSGRDEDKIEKTGLTVLHIDGIPFFEQSKIALLCKKLYAQEFKPECFLSQKLNDMMYPDGDHHTFYIAEVKKILIKQ